MREEAFSRHIAALLRARFPFIWVRSWEEERVVGAIAKTVRDPSLVLTPRAVHDWSLTAGMTTQLVKGEPRAIRSPLNALQEVESTYQASVFVLRDFHVFLGNERRHADRELVRKIRDIAPHLKECDPPKSVIFVSPSVRVPHDLEKDISVIDLDLPDEEELTAVLRRTLTANRRAGHIDVFELDDEHEEELVKAARGLTAKEAENAFSLALQDEDAMRTRDIQLVVREKRQAVRRSGVIDFVEHDGGFESLGGLENLKRWLRKRDRSWLDLARGYGVPYPKGVLITGVPGCGKSLTAKCTAGAWGLPLVRLDIGRVFSELVGSSERNMRDALSTVEAISPAILWIDEIEKGFGAPSSGARSGDSGTSQRVFGTFLTWMQEKSAFVFVIATANSIGEMPPEFMRKGRFDEVFFVDLPTAAEREPIVRVHLESKLEGADAIGNFKPNRSVVEELVELSEGYSGAEIEQAVIAGLTEAFSERREVAMEDFRRALANMVPLAVLQEERVAELREWARIRAVSATDPDDLPDSPLLGDQHGGRPVEL